MSNNFESFIAEFNKLHDVLKEKSNNSSKFVDFRRLIDELENNSVVKKHKKQLHLIRELRNILVHEKKDSKYNLAEPSSELINDMIEIRNQIEYPTKVNKIFKNHVQCFNAEDNLKDVLNYIKDKSYTQFPVFDKNEFLGLVSDNGITFWLSEVIKEEIVDLSEVRVADVIGHDENRMNYVPIKADMSLYNVDELFSRRIRNGERGVVLLITALGKIEKPEDIIGIITPWDLPKINEKL